MKRSLLAYAIAMAIAFSPVSASAMKAIPVHGLKAMTWDADLNINEKAKFANEVLEPATRGSNPVLLLAYAGEDPADILGYTGVVFSDGEAAGILQSLTRVMGTKTTHTPSNTMNETEMASTHAQLSAAQKMAELVYSDPTADKPHMWEKALGIVQDLPATNEVRSMLKTMVLRSVPNADLGLAQAHTHAVTHHTPVLDVQNTPQVYDVGSGDKDKKGKFIKGINKLSTKSGIIIVATH